MRTNRNRNATEETTVETTTDETQAETTEAPATEAQGTDTASDNKRGARGPLDVGTVTARVSSRTDLKSRPSPTETNPVYLAVKAADFDTPTDLSVDPDKVGAVVKILRRAAAPDKLNVGMTVFPGNPVDEADPTKVIVTFQKSAEKKRSKGAASATTEG